MLQSLIKKVRTQTTIKLNNKGRLDNDTDLLPLLSVYAHDTQNLWSGRCRYA